MDNTSDSSTDVEMGGTREELKRAQTPLRSQEHDRTSPNSANANQDDSEPKIIDYFDFIGPSKNIRFDQDRFAKFEWQYFRQGHQKVTVSLIARLGLRVSVRRFMKNGQFRDLDFQFNIVDNNQVLFADHFRGTPKFTEFLHNSTNNKSQFQVQQTQQLQRQTQQLQQVALQLQQQRYLALLNDRGMIRAKRHAPRAPMPSPNLVQNLLSHHQLKQMSWMEDGTFQVKFRGPYEQGILSL